MMRSKNYTLKGNVLKRDNGEICNSFKGNAVSVVLATNNEHSMVYLIFNNYSPKAK